MRLPALCLLICCGAIPGAQLPLHRYTTADGLPSNSVPAIAVDSRGFLWFATSEGLSRFDGVGFSTMQGIPGLPRNAFRQLLIDRRGVFWLVTDDSVVRFRPDLPPSNRERTLLMHPAFDAHPLTLLEDRAGRIWVGTDRGLYVLHSPGDRAPAFVEVDLGLPHYVWGDSDISAIAEDADGAIWAGTSEGTLYRRGSDGEVRHCPSPLGAQTGITRLVAARDGHLWMGRANGLYRSKAATGGLQDGPDSCAFDRLSGSRGGPPDARVFDIFQARSGDIWAPMYRCLAQFPAGGGAVRLWNQENGIPSRGVGVMAEDRDGNLWMGTGDLGVLKLAAGGMLTYSAADGLDADGVISIGETLRGDLFFSGRQEAGGFRIAFQSGTGFQALSPRVPPSVTYFGWRPARVVLQDHLGEWWLASSQGLCHYPRLDSPRDLAKTLPDAIYTKRDGLPSNIVVRLYEDRRGDVWAGTEAFAFARWNRQTGKFVAVSPSGGRSFPTAFGEDAAGNIWVGDDGGSVWRVQGDRATRIAQCSPAAVIRAIQSDPAGRLWIATGGQGLLRFDDPTASQPQFRRYGYTDGLSTVSLYSMAVSNGAVWIGTGGGVDRLDPDRNRIRHYTAADGIAPGQVIAAYADRRGVLWFGTNHGLTRFVPDGVSDRASPVWMTGVSVGGRREAVSEIGESAVKGLEVRPGQEHIQFDFVGLSYSPGNVLSYQYRLGSEAWSSPIGARSVHYGALPPGAYRFAVRAVNSDGANSLEAATVDFRVIPPLWQRIWFQLFLAASLLAVAVGAHWLRTARLIEIERVRSGIALDLHDDIASNLAQITIFSEIAMREAGPGSGAGAPLTRIAETARETVECIGDIVWSMRPQKEGDLVQRIRRFGSDALTSRQIEVRFDFADEVRRLPLDPNTRRQVYLIYKEAVHNIVRHAHAAVVQISMNVIGAELLLLVRDDGAGFQSHEEGNGLPGMRTRAASLGGALSIRSAPGKGTELELRAPWRQRRRYRILLRRVGPRDC